VGTRVKRTVIVANKKVKHGIAGAARHGLDDLIRIGGHTGVPDGDGIERLQVMDKAQGPVLLLNAELPGVVGGVGVLVNACGALLLEEVDDLIADAGQDGNVTVSPWNMFDNGDFNW
jgi:hypothetical protein